jgi:ABC-type thiamine transport system substrate-binding protein
LRQSKLTEQCLLLLVTSACCCFVLGEHKLEIAKYSSYKSLKENECVVSEKFEVAGHEWVS